MKHAQGVLCLVVSADTDEGRKKFVGRAVELIMPVSSDWPVEFQGMLWSPDEGDCWIVVGNICRGNLGYTMLREKHLFPIYDVNQPPAREAEDVL